MALTSPSSRSVRASPTVPISISGRRPSSPRSRISTGTFHRHGFSPKPNIPRISAELKARFVAKRVESTSVQQLQRPLAEYMSLPASQYSVLDAERIERVNENTFRCYVYRLRFFSFEVCPVLLVRVDEEPSGCCIRLLSCQVDPRVGRKTD